MAPAPCLPSMAAFSRRSVLCTRFVDRLPILQLLLRGKWSDSIGNVGVQSGPGSRLTFVHSWQHGKLSFADGAEHLDECRWTSFLDGAMRMIAPIVRILDVNVRDEGGSGGERLKTLLDIFFAQLCTMDWRFTQIAVRPTIISGDPAVIGAVLNGVRRVLEVRPGPGTTAFEFVDCIKGP